MSDSTAFKDFYNRRLAGEMGEELALACTEFDASAFVARISAEVDSLEFKDRIRLFAKALQGQLPAHFADAWAILERVMPRTSGEAVAETPSAGVFTHGFALWPIARYIQDYGLEDFDSAVRAMHTITGLHTAEFAVRPFIERYPQRMLSVLNRWVNDPSEHVRRLVSEGTRPRLPWAGRLNQFIEDPTPTLALLEQLKDDSSEYVRRSVANHLNDIGKDHPDLLLTVAARWQRGTPPPERQRIIKHALRTLVKAGNPEALRLLGYGPAMVTLRDMRVAPERLLLGKSLEIEFTLESLADAPQNLVIDYIIHFVKANGTTSPKVFKLTTRTLEPGEFHTIRRRHAIRPITTRRYYPGRNRVEIQVNGRVLAVAEFDLIAQSGDETGRTS